LRQLMQQNVELIKSIPTQAAERIGKLIQENMMQSRRPAEVAQMIMETEGVTRSRATLIARTEVSKASLALTQARATSIGSTGYIWRTANDRIVRLSHKKMNGKFVKWTEPVTLDKMTGHAGGFPNCRCYAEPEVPDEN
jgi:SPP1 gp7 family putative phage head morphogenesis protein